MKSYEHEKLSINKYVIMLKNNIVRYARIFQRGKYT